MVSNRVGASRRARREADQWSREVPSYKMLENLFKLDSSFLIKVLLWFLEETMKVSTFLKIESGAENISTLFSLFLYGPPYSLATRKSFFLQPELAAVPWNFTFTRGSRCFIFILALNCNCTDCKFRCWPGKETGGGAQVAERKMWSSGNFDLSDDVIDFDAYCLWWSWCLQEQFLRRWKD